MDIDKGYVIIWETLRDAKAAYDIITDKIGYNSQLPPFKATVLVHLV